MEARTPFSICLLKRRPYLPACSRWRFKGLYLVGEVCSDISAWRVKHEVGVPGLHDQLYYYRVSWTGAGTTLVSGYRISSRYLTPIDLPVVREAERKGASTPIETCWALRYVSWVEAIVSVHDSSCGIDLHWTWRTSWMMLCPKPRQHCWEWGQKGGPSAASHVDIGKQASVQEPPLACDLRYSIVRHLYQTTEDR